VLDILAYLVGRFLDHGLYPDAETLSRQLIAAGFDGKEVEQALQWLAGLEPSLDSVPAALSGLATKPHSVRQFTNTEEQKITRESRGYLLFLEGAGALPPVQRELVLERAMALDATEVDVEQIKVVVLLVLWSQQRPLDSLMLDELLAAERVGTVH
jgi:Smg protein